MDILRRMQTILGNLLIYCLSKIAGSSAVTNVACQVRGNIYILSAYKLSANTQQIIVFHSTNYVQAALVAVSVSQSDLPTRSRYVRNVC